mgnify:CR=1 FL=1
MFIFQTPTYLCESQTQERQKSSDAKTFISFCKGNKKGWKQWKLHCLLMFVLLSVVKTKQEGYFYHLSLMVLNTLSILN